MPMIENWKLVVTQRYALFEGRSGRAEFWWYALANFLVSLVLNALGYASPVFLVLSFIWWIALIIPSIAVGIRRLHDADNSGWFLLLAFLPILGAIILIVMFAQEGTSGPNDYGTDSLPAAT